MGTCRRSLTDGPQHRPIRAKEVLFPGVFGDVAVLSHPSEEIYQIKKQTHSPEKHSYR